MADDHGPPVAAGPATPPPAAPYETAAPNAYEWTERAYELLVAGRLTAAVRSMGGVQAATVDGPCPRCDHDVRFHEVLDAVSGEAFSTLGERAAAAPATGYVELVVSCRCTAAHEGRPDTVDHGCGVNFRVDVLADP